MAVNVIDTSPDFIEKRLKEVAEYQQKVKSLLTLGTDYGIAKTNSKKFTLLKAGAEKIKLAFKFTDEYEIIKCNENFNGNGFFSYMIKCRLYNNGTECGQGLGSTNSKELQWAYKWLEENFLPPNTDITNLPVKYDNDKHKKYYRVEDETQSKANTMLKIAKKRALVDAVLNACALSDVFTQDFDDLPDEIQNPQTPVPNKENIIPLNTFKCSNCNADIPQAVYKYSKERFKKPLCMNCQNKLKKTKNNNK